MSDTGDESETPRADRFLRLRPIHVDLGDVLVQIVAVGLGVTLGFALTSWNERVHESGLLHATVGNVVAELSSNQSGMHGVLGDHAKAASTLLALLASAKASKSITLEQGSHALGVAGHFRENVPLSIAWQIAQNDQGLTLLPYQDRYDLAWVYQLQSAYYQTEQQYRTSLLTLAESPNGNYYFQAGDLTNQIQSVVEVERQLDVLYTHEIKHLRDEFGV
jgi:hypothetical protein